jgi:hypothetical protein
MAQLNGIRDPVMRRAWRDGDWTVAIGSMFGDVFSTNKHVLPFSIMAEDIPDNWPRFRAFDWGSSTPFCCLWYTIATGEETNNKSINKMIGHPFAPGTMIFYREYYGWKPGNGRNEGVKLGSNEVATNIHDIEMREGERGRVRPGPADTQIFSVLDGTPIYANFDAKGVYFRPPQSSARRNALEDPPCWSCQSLRNFWRSSCDHSPGRSTTPPVTAPFEKKARACSSRARALSSWRRIMAIGETPIQ